MVGGNGAGDVKDGRFEVGDRVRVRSGEAYSLDGVELFEGREYVVTAMDDNSAPVHVDGMSRWGTFGWGKNRFELVEPEIPERDATPDEAYELGTVAGYDEAKREDEDGWWDVDGVDYFCVATTDLATLYLSDLDALGFQVRVQVRRKP